MRAYLRKDGNYDLYTVKPQTISKEQYDALKRQQEQKRSELQQRATELEAQQNAIAAALAAVKAELQQYSEDELPEMVEPTVAEVPQHVADAAVIRRKSW